MADTNEKNRVTPANDVEKHEPSHTTKGKITSPKFGAAGSGGAENEPVPEQHDEKGNKKS